MDSIHATGSSSEQTNTSPRLLRHVVILTFADHAPSDIVDQLVPKLRELGATIPGLLSYHVGPDAGIDAGNGSFSIVGDFADQNAYEGYRDDPTHQAIIAGLVRPNISARTASQYWVTRSD